MTIVAGAFSLLAPGSTLLAADVVNCPSESLTKEIGKAEPGDTITFTGVCPGPISISIDNLTLKGTGSAAIDGGGRNAVTVAGAHGVSLVGFEVRNGLNGILARNGAHIEITSVTARNNRVFGISLQTGSSAAITNSATQGNGLHGLDLETGSSAVVAGTFASSGNTVFGVNVNGSSITFSQATATVSGNAVGIQVATSANAFLNDPATTLNCSNNLATGLTVVSGAHMVVFGGKINSTGNGSFGVSINSKGGLDLDAGSVLTTSNNRGGGLALQQQSVMTVFNIPQFSGVPGFSTVNATGNTGNGIAVLTGSTLTLADQAQINSTANSGFGLQADNGAGVTLRNSSLTGNTTKDVNLTFGTRADIQTAISIGTLSCDATVLIRGVSGFACPR
jgi:hypothetical protein